MAALIPISDANPTRRLPIATITIIAINIVIFLFVEPGFGQSGPATEYFYEHAPVPCQLRECPAPIEEVGIGAFMVSAIYSTFLHAGFMHIIGNMLFLWVFGNNIEDYLGRVKYVAFYLLGGLAASMAHAFWSLRIDPMSDSQVVACLTGAATSGCVGLAQYVPSVGASGAVAAVMGAYLVLYPRARVNVLVPIFILLTVVQMSALIVLAIWFLYQFLIGAPDIAGIAEGGGGVAWTAHVGGFAFGAAAILLLGGRPHPDVRDPSTDRASWYDDRFDR